MMKKVLELLRVTFDDGSVFGMPLHDWQVAFNWKYGPGANEELAGRIRDEVDEYWRNAQRTWANKAMSASELVHSDLMDAWVALLMAEGGSTEEEIRHLGDEYVRALNDIDPSRWDICPACCTCPVCVSIRVGKPVACVCVE